jgi:hypothetical protein
LLLQNGTLFKKPGRKAGLCAPAEGQEGPSRSTNNGCFLLSNQRLAGIRAKGTKVYPLVSSGGTSDCCSGPSEPMRTLLPFSHAGADEALALPALNPDFLYAALDATTYAAFVKESRKKRGGATKMHRKSGKRVIRVEALSRSAKALLPPHKCGGSHHEFRSFSFPGRLRKNSCFVSGHDFSRAVNDWEYVGL